MNDRLLERVKLEPIKYGRKHYWRHNIISYTLEVARRGIQIKVTENRLRIRILLTTTFRLLRGRRREQRMWLFFPRIRAQAISSCYVLARFGPWRREVGMISHPTGQAWATRNSPRRPLVPCGLLCQGPQVIAPEHLAAHPMTTRSSPAVCCG
jgi:hypothetical protein